ncbi:peptidoglycan-binding protein [Cellulosimicrobium cellulans]|uniref:peptidoglycan-binding protein n=1 Tax=Cellulosimicrobium cellulans TaxID=1710 RepID=UPI0036514AD9
MSTSQNGWPVIAKGTDPALVAIPKIIGRVRKGDVAAVLAHLVDRFDREVEDVDVGRDDWGYANRSVVGGTSTSNHASGTAIDLNATRHVLGRVGTFSTAQVRALRKILADLGGVVRWGGDYAGRKDEMHFEINAGASRVRAVAAALDARLVDNPCPGPTPPPAVTKRKPKPLPPMIKEGSRGGWVGLWQSIARTQGETIRVDEDFGDATTAATKRIQKRWGLVPDGVVGPKTWLRALISDRSGSLAYGDNGPQVELLQNILGIKLDRNFGPATRDAVAQVQRYLGIRDDGAAGGATNAALRRHYRA